VAGPLDILDDDAVGVMNEDLAAAVHRVLGADRSHCAAVGRRYDWSICTAQFVDGLTPILRRAAA